MLSEVQTAEFVQQLTACQSRLYAYVITLLGNGRDAGDVLQETNAVLWKKVADYDPARPFLAWAYGFAKLQVMAQRKKQSRERLLFDDELLNQVSEEYLRQDAGAERQLAALAGCLEKLTSKQRALIQERYASGISVNALAERQATDANSISAMLYRIRQTLAECIRKQLALGES